MTVKQYKILNGLHLLSPQMDDEQKYSSHFISEVEKVTKMSKEDVLAIAKELEAFGYVSLVQNNVDAKEHAGYIHLIRITYRGVLAKNSYLSSIFTDLFKELIIPAIVSIVCSLIVSYLT